ncbi:MAG: IclR family transcriptional regulator [Lachnospiraceae bacterium]|nr:IclR family transcriptional regulator [Lachnospiraceae bacterium]
MSEIKVKSLQKALEILNCFIEEPMLGVTELSEKFGFYKSNVHNILTTFKALGYLEQDEISGKYKLGIQAFKLGYALKDTFSIIKICLPFMQELANQADQRVYLAIPYGREIYYLEATYPIETVTLMRSVFGMKADYHCTGLGKAMLAFMPSDFIEEIIDMGLHRYTENTITDPECLRKEMLVTRQRGYAIDNMEHEFGVKCVSLPILGADGRVSAALSISGSFRDFSEEHIKKYALILKDAIMKIEKRL